MVCAPQDHLREAKYVDRVERLGVADDRAGVAPRGQFSAGYSASAGLLDVPYAVGWVADDPDVVDGQRAQQLAAIAEPDLDAFGQNLLTQHVSDSSSVLCPKCPNGQNVYE
jgi:hypothetical protein